ncbi:hypothetical protein [Tychonema sp. LEGE 06208]|uniref:hypothetical protein n=1 Tax=Tychonema sp. LEGE 06208 TaxID=1828663 RepID=UPI00351C37E5
MSDVAEAFWETAMQKQVYPKMNPKIIAQVFVGMFAVACFSQNTMMDPNALVMSP